MEHRATIQPLNSYQSVQVISEPWQPKRFRTGVGAVPGFRPAHTSDVGEPPMMMRGKKSNKIRRRPWCMWV